jgi:hypothetical protein
MVDVTAERATLTFPNPDRSYDAAMDRISFFGNDGTAEVTFFLKAQALLRLYPRTGGSGPALLAAFDAGRVRINEVANKAFARDRRRFYVLGLENL